MRIPVLKTMTFLDNAEADLAAAFEVISLPDSEAEREALLDRVGKEIRGVATNSRGPITADLLDRLPQLEIIACQSAGMEGIDVVEARNRGIVVTNASEVVATDVADIAIALLLNLVRRVPHSSRFLAEGRWATGRFPLTRRIAGMRLGIFGLGPIGREIARRAEAMRMEIGYFGRNPKQGAGYRYFDRLSDMASWAGVLVISCPGGAATRHAVDRDILEALGPDGYLINIARGSVVDEADLTEMLLHERIAGAGLDVLEHEPQVPADLLASERVVLTPHIGSSTIETKFLMGDAMVASLRNHFGLQVAAGRNA